MSRNEPCVHLKFDFDLQRFCVTQNFNCSSIPSILLGHQVAKAYALTIPKWNCIPKMMLLYESCRSVIHLVIVKDPLSAYTCSIISNMDTIKAKYNI